MYGTNNYISTHTKGLPHVYQMYATVESSLFTPNPNLPFPQINKSVFNHPQ